MDWLNYHHLLHFWHVAREGTIQRASEVLHVTPATVSVQVRKLEKSLGVELVRKRGRGIELTETGHRVKEYADAIFSTGRELLEMVRGTPSGRPVRLNVGVKDVMPKLVAHRLLAPAFELGDAIRIECREGGARQLVADLAVHRLDVVLSDTPLDPLLKVRAYSHLLGESGVVVMGTPALASKLRKNFPKSLDGAPFLLPTDDTMLRHSLETWFEKHELRPVIRAEFADSAMLKIAGRSGAGAFAVPMVIEDDAAAMYGVERIGEADDLVERFYALTVERRIAHPAVVAISKRARMHLFDRDE